MFDTQTSAESRRDVGIETAEEKANRDKVGWSEDAMHGLELYCLAHDDKEFLAEEVRDWTAEMSLVGEPENGRAWGGVFQRAARQGMIVRVGYAPSKSSNLSPKCLWRAA